MMLFRPRDGTGIEALRAASPKFADEIEPGLFVYGYVIRIYEDGKAVISENVHFCHVVVNAFRVFARLRNTSKTEK